MRIYVLQLEKNKYYVGKTNNVSQCLLSHYQSTGSSWTTKYKPIELYEMVDTDDDYDEDKYTLKYMKKYGIENVRGGSFTQIELSENQINTLQQMIKGQNNQCYKCGSNDHFVNNCIFTQIESVVNNLHNKQEIISKLESVSNAYERISKLEDIRSQTQHILEFSVSDLRTKKRYDDLTKELSKYRQNNRWNSSDGNMKLMKTIHEEIEDIRNEFGFDKINKLEQIGSLYGRFFNEEHIKNEGNIIKGMKLRRLAIQTNEELEVLYKEYKNIDYLEELLVALYEKLENA